jgi:iron complex outermembrane recepter protein
MFKKTKVCSGLMLAFGGTLIAASGQVIAQQELQRVEVTGSSIKRVQAEAPTTVQTVTKGEIERSGVSSVNELILKLPGFSSFNDELNATGAPTRATVGFRQFDSSNVLLLINGRRISKNASNASAYDLNSIPLSALERVDILKDGASAIYGADAVAGVINFITKSNFKGFEAKAEIGNSSRNDGGETRFSGAAGIGDYDKDGYNLLFTGELFSREILFRRDREASFRKGPGQYNEASPTGNIQSPGTGGTFKAINACREALVTDGQGTYCPYYFNQDINLIPGTDRLGGMAFFNKKINEDNKFFAEALLSSSASKNSFSAPPGRFRDVPIPAGGLTLADGTNLPAGQLTTIRIRYDQSGVRRFLPESTFTRLATGLEGTVKNFDYKLEVGKSTTVVDEIKTGFFDYASARADITAGTFNPFVVPTASQIKKYEVAGSVVSRTSIAFVNASGSTELFKLPGGAAAIAVGVTANRESLDFSPDANSQAGRVSATGTPDTPVTGSRNLKAVYGELSLPLIKGLETQVAIRHDRYSDVGSVTVPKFAAKYVVVPALAVRGSYSKGFIAPAFEDLYRDNIESAEFAKDTALCAAQNISRTDCVTTQYDTRNRSNPELKPEKSKAIALGLIFEPNASLSSTLDYYHITKTDKIDRSIQYIIDNPNKIFNGKLGRDYLTRGTATPGSGGLGVIEIADSPILNVAEEQAKGVEVGVTYKFGESSLGRFTIDNQFVRNLSYKKAQAPGEPLLEYVGLIDKPKYRDVLRLTWEKAGWTVSTAYNMMGGFLDAQEPTDVDATTKKVPSFNTFDLQIVHKGLLGKGTSFALGIKNLMDKKPTPTDNDQNAGFPASQSATGRYISTSFTAAF